MTSPRIGLPDRSTIVARLAAAGCIAADAEADELLREMPDAPTLERWIEGRERGVPLPWLIGSTTFAGRRVVIEPGVYVPRLHSEQLAGRAAGHLARHPGRAADLCAGSGAIAAHLRAEVPSAVVVTVDVDERAVRNARRNGVPSVVGDMGAPLCDGSFRVVVCVAPYVPTDELAYLPADVRRHEPLIALDGGDDGLDLVRRAIDDAARILAPGGWFLTEIGGGQESAVTAVLDTAGFDRVSAWHDGDGDLRGIEGRLRAG
jgi:release factor glutamine methyltransferase